MHVGRAAEGKAGVVVAKLMQNIPRGLLAIGRERRRERSERWMTRRRIPHENGSRGFLMWDCWLIRFLGTHFVGIEAKRLITLLVR